MICPRCLRLPLLAIVSVATLTAGSASTWANVYPTNLGQSANTFSPSSAQTVTLSYLLNEDATNGVNISILNASNTVVRTINAGTQSKGSNSVIWDGKDDSNVILPVGNYSFRVTSAGADRADWLNGGINSIATPLHANSTLNNFEVPRGVAVNRNPNSPYYGRIYVANARNLNTAAGRTMLDALYMLNADTSDTGIAGGTGPYSGNIDWNNTATDVVSPFRLEVGPDDSVYITDWSDPHSGLWQAPADLSGTFTEVLDNTGRAASGLNATHGSIADVVIKGTGANRVIYTFDEDFVPAGGSTGSILRYDIGTTTTFTGPPSGYAYMDGTGSNNRIINFLGGVAIANDGTFWISQLRAGIAAETAPSLMQVDASGNVLWTSVPSLAADSLTDPLRGIQGMAYDPVNNVIALATNRTATGPTRQGLVVIFDPVTKTVREQFYVGSASSTTNTDVSFDNAGNLYLVNRSAERMYVYAPPTSGDYVANMFSTDSLGALGSIALTASAGLLGDFNGNGIVDGADYVLWRKNNGTNNALANDNGLGTPIGPSHYALWRANFGNPPGAGSGLSDAAVPEPASIGLTVLGLVALASARRRVG